MNFFHDILFLISIFSTIATAAAVFGGLTGINFFVELSTRFALTLRHLLRAKPSAKYVVPAGNLMVAVFFLHINWLDVATMVIISALMVEIAFWCVLKMYFDVR